MRWEMTGFFELRSNLLTVYLAITHCKQCRFKWQNGDLTGCNVWNDCRRNETICSLTYHRGGCWACRGRSTPRRLAVRGSLSAGRTSPWRRRWKNGDRWANAPRKCAAVHGLFPLRPQGLQDCHPPRVSHRLRSRPSARPGCSATGMCGGRRDCLRCSPAARYPSRYPPPTGCGSSRSHDQNSRRTPPWG